MKLLDAIQQKGKYRFMFGYAYQKIGKRTIFISSSPPLHLTLDILSLSSAPCSAAVRVTDPRGASPIPPEKGRRGAERCGEAEGCGAAAEGAWGSAAEQEGARGAEGSRSGARARRGVATELEGSRGARGRAEGRGGGATATEASGEVEGEVGRLRNECKRMRRGRNSESPKWLQQ